MTRSLANILAEADEVIEKIASESNASPAASEDDDLFKLAQEVRDSAPAPMVAEPVAPVQEFEMTPLEKIAEAIAIVETAVSANELHGLSKLEKVAAEREIPNEEVQGFFAKVAEKNLVGRRAITCVEEAARSIQSYCAE